MMSLSLIVWSKFGSVCEFSQLPCFPLLRGWMATRFSCCCWQDFRQIDFAIPSYDCVTPLALTHEQKNAEDHASLSTVFVTEGVYVAVVDPDGQAHQLGVQPGLVTTASAPFCHLLQLSN